MHLSELDYDLPEELIAQRPADRRDASRLFVLRRGEPPSFGHRPFVEFPDLLAPGDLLVLNDTRVVAARLVGRRARTEGKWEGLFVRVRADGLWEVLIQTRGQLLTGETLLVESAITPPLRLTVMQKTPQGRWLVQPNETGSAEESLARHGQVPIPPYIRKGRPDARDAERYQTVYARSPGAVAAPTAGLHFTPEVFARLAERGIERASVTLHVGPGTFQPIKAEDVREHRVEAEWGEVPAETLAAIAACKRRGGKVIAVGTTTTRALEGLQIAAASQPDAPARVPSQPDAPARVLSQPDAPARDSSNLQSACNLQSEVGLTICPPFAFQVVDALLTNFHLPRSSLLLLVAAFAGLGTMREAYAEAVRLRYRFYSYGDAMLIL